VLGHARSGLTLALTGTSVAALALGGVALANAKTRVNHGGLLHDEAVRDQPANILTRLGQIDVARLEGVQPDLEKKKEEKKKKKKKKKKAKCDSPCAFRS
jgi:hypothetical protein